MYQITEDPDRITIHRNPELKTVKYLRYNDNVLLELGYNPASHDDTLKYLVKALHYKRSRYNTSDIRKIADRLGNCRLCTRGFDYDEATGVILPPVSGVQSKTGATGMTDITTRSMHVMSFGRMQIPSTSQLMTELKRDPLEFGIKKLGLATIMGSMFSGLWEGYLEAQVAKGRWQRGDKKILVAATVTPLILGVTGWGVNKVKHPAAKFIGLSLIASAGHFGSYVLRNAFRGLFGGEQYFGNLGSFSNGFLRKSTSVLKENISRGMEAVQSKKLALGSGGNNTLDFGTTGASLGIINKAMKQTRVRR